MKVEEAMRQRGLVEGLAANQAVQLQRAFDNGFVQGALIGFSTGEKLYGKLKNGETAPGELHIAKVLL